MLTLTLTLTTVKQYVDPLKGGRHKYVLTCIITIGKTINPSRHNKFRSVAHYLESIILDKKFILCMYVFFPLFSSTYLDLP